MRLLRMHRTGILPVLATKKVESLWDLATHDALESVSGRASFALSLAFVGFDLNADHFSF